MNSDGSDQVHVTAVLDAQRQIADLVHRYAQCIRYGEPANSADLLADDVTFKVEERDPVDRLAAPRLRSENVGKQAVLASICRSAGGGVRVFPIIHNLLIEVDGDTATGNCLMESRTWPKGHEFIGEYHDSFRRIDGKWQFASRSFAIFKSAGE